MLVYGDVLDVRQSIKFDSVVGQKLLADELLLCRGQFQSRSVARFSTRKRMELVERQLASLTGLVQTALTGAVGVHVQQPPRADSNGPDATTGLALSSEEGNK